MLSEAAAWLILILPFAAFGVIGLIVRPFFNRYAQAAGWLTIGAIGAAFILALFALSSVVSADGGVVDEYPVRHWIELGGMTLSFGILMDPLTAIMLVVVAGVSLLVQIYSQGYMKGDPGYARYYAYMALFTGSMLGLVMSRDIVQLFVFWELVGVSSYLLIGFWFHRPAAAAAAKKAFIVTRVGDFGFLLAILYLFTQGGELLDIPALYEALAAGAIATSVATWIALGIFAGAVGKSAQFPLHTWLSDAMEGPTPVSALIHSATMVTAGVFLVARFLPLFEAAPAAMNTVALIGGFTAVFAATMALVSNDIKRVLAYSTVSQLGYMMMSLGLGIYVAAIFHLFTHAAFKALLFLGAGSVNHATGTFDMRYMGGLRRVMPWTYGTVVIGAMSLAGIFPLSGFWSKDEVLSGALEPGSAAGYAVFLLGLGAVALTAFYMARAIFMTFHGKFRGGAGAEAAALAPLGGREDHPDAPDEGAGGDGATHAVTGHGGAHMAESPLVMIAPMLVLAVLAVGAGALANPVADLGFADRHALGEFLTENEPVFADHAAAVEAGAEPEFNFAVAVGSSVLALAGIGLAYLMYVRGSVSPAAWAARVPRLYNLLLRKYFMDELYEDLIVRRGLYGGLTAALDKADRSLIDDANVRLSLATGQVGRLLAKVQNGQTQMYALVIASGIFVLLAAYLVWGA